MKSTNKEHELDEIANKLLLEFNGRSKFYIYGAGKLGKLLYEKLKCKNQFSAFIDNDNRKQRDGFCSEKVITFKEYLKVGDKNIIIIAASEKNTIEIKNQLNEQGLIENKDYYLYDGFMKEIYPIINLYTYNELYIELCQIVLTERCTLRCKKCAHACYAADNMLEDMSIEMAYKSADSFFEKVDLINEFVLIGGEPFLYKKLPDIIEYIGKKYRNQINIFSITTNGTITPKRDVLEMCKKYHVLIRISNYSEQIKRLKKQYEVLIKTLEDFGVEYDITPEHGHWMDYGFEYVDNGDNPEQLISIFDNCKTPCREIRGSKLYYCVMARSVADNLHKNVGKDDYLDFDSLSEKDYKRQILEYTYGYSEKGYLDMCRYCHGAEARKYIIPVAEQLSL